jgi:folylpolyglutamate synthase
MVFNLTKGRSGPDFLNTILRTLQSQLDDLAPGERAEDFFDHIIFCSNITYEDGGFKKGVPECLE